MWPGQQNLIVASALTTWVCFHACTHAHTRIHTHTHTHTHAYTHTHTHAYTHTPFFHLSPPVLLLAHPRKTPGDGTLINQLEALDLGLVCLVAGRQIKDNSMVLSSSLVVLVLHEVHACCMHGYLLLAWKTNSRAPWPLHHMARARAAAISYTTKDKSSVVHYQAHHKEIGSACWHARTHARTHAHEHTCLCMHAPTHIQTHMETCTNAHKCYAHKHKHTDI